MSTKHFCDSCGAETSDARMKRITIATHDNSKSYVQADLCLQCMLLFTNLCKRVLNDRAALDHAVRALPVA